MGCLKPLKIAFHHDCLMCSVFFRCCLYNEGTSTIFGNSCNDVAMDYCVSNGHSMLHVELNIQLIITMQLLVVLIF